MKSIAAINENAQPGASQNSGLKVISFNRSVRESQSTLALKLLKEYSNITNMEHTVDKYHALTNWREKVSIVLGNMSEANLAELQS